MRRSTSGQRVRDDRRADGEQGHSLQEFRPKKVRLILNRFCYDVFNFDVGI